MATSETIGTADNDLIYASNSGYSIDGGDGSDTVVFSGKRSDYAIRYVNGRLIVKDLRVGALEDRILTNIEMLRFSDVQIIDAPKMFSGLAPTVQSGVFDLSGPASVTGGTQVKVTIGSTVTVTDNAGTGVLADLVSDGSTINSFTAENLTGAGVELNWQTNSAGASITGSQGADRIFSGSGDDVIYCGAGNDQVYAGTGNNVVYGGAGNDFLSASITGDNTYIGGEGIDKIDGGLSNGTDIAVFSGNAGDYSIYFDYYKNLVVKDMRAAGTDGTDYLTNIEKMQFADGIIDTPKLTTQLVATVNNGAFTLSGAAAVANWTQINVKIGETPSVQDVAAQKLMVDVNSDGSTITSFAATDVTGTGVWVSWSGSEAATVTGSRYADRVWGGIGNDVIDGGLGDDYLSGYSGNDVIIGGSGSDTIDGGNGIDTAVFSGNRSDYALALDAANCLTVTDLRAGGTDGADRLNSVEMLRFADGTIDAVIQSTKLVATRRDGAFTLSGAAWVAGGSQIGVSVSDLGAWIYDNNPFRLAEQISVTSDGTKLTSFTAEGLTGAGINFKWYSADGTITGSQYGDSICGHTGNDVIIGGKGDDAINGGDGIDIAAYSGNYGDYTIAFDAQGYLTIQDNRADGEGLDRLSWIEKLQFNGGITIDVADLFNVAPTVTTTDGTCTKNKSVSISDRISIGDADGDPTARIQIWDSSNTDGSGFLRFNGTDYTRLSASNLLEIGGSDLANLSYVGGSTVSSEVLHVRAFDGTDWSQWASFTMSTLNTAPTASAVDGSCVKRKAVSIGNLISMGDADGDAITKVQFWDSANTSGSGYLRYNGTNYTKLSASNVLEVTAFDPSKLQYVGADTVSSETVQVRAFDGTEWSQWASFTMSTTGSVSLKDSTGLTQTTTTTTVSDTGGHGKNSGLLAAA